MKNQGQSGKDNKNNSNKSKQESDNNNNQNNINDSYLDNKPKENSSKDLTVAPNGYKDANTAKTRLPQTGIPQVVVGFLIISAMVSGILLFKYRKM